MLSNTDKLSPGILLRLLGKLQTCTDTGNKTDHVSVSLPVELLFDDDGFMYNHEEDEKEDEVMKGEENKNYSSDLV